MEIPEKPKHKLNKSGNAPMSHRSNMQSRYLDYIKKQKELNQAKHQRESTQVTFMQMPTRQIHFNGNEDLVEKKKMQNEII